VASGLRQSAEALRERIGPSASYTSFVRPSISDVEPRQRRSRGTTLLRLLWRASLALLVVVLILAVVVAFGL